MGPQFEGEITIAHLQGYLYSQQVIANAIMENVASAQEYAFYQLDLEGIEGEDLELPETILKFAREKLAANKTILYWQQQLVEKEAILERLPNWKDSMAERLAYWFADRHLNTNFSKAKDDPTFFKDFTEEDKAQWLAKMEIYSAEKNEELQKTKSSILNFIPLVYAVVGGPEMEVWFFSLKDEFKNTVDPMIGGSRGLVEDIILFKNREKTYLLYLGTVLT